MVSDRSTHGERVTPRTSPRVARMSPATALEIQWRTLRTSIDRLSKTPERQVILLTLVTALATGCSLLLSWKLWLSTRLFPLSPVADYFPTVPYPVDYVWLLSLLALLAAISFLPRSRGLILIFLCFALLLSLLDQTRWQPWFYQYLFMLASVCFLAWKRTEVASSRVALNACRLIVVSIYLWSGLQKLNVTFVRETWPDMASFLPGFWQDVANHVPPFLILIIPLVEIAIGFGLLTRRFRSGAVIVATATHVGILILLVVSGENIVVWPWNAAMVLFVWTLFWRDRETTSRNVIAGQKFFHGLVLILFGVMPAFNFVDLWDSYLSSALYSGNTHQAVIYVSESVIARLPASIHPHIWRETKPFFLDINRWAYDELHVPVYPEPRVYRHITRQICQYAEGDSNIELRIKGRPDTLSGRRGSKYFDCDHLY
jgi:hypothetical protein